MAGDHMNYNCVFDTLAGHLKLKHGTKIISGHLVFTRDLNWQKWFDIVEGVRY